MKSYLRILLLLLFSLFHASAYCQIRVYGTVTSSSTNEPVEYCNIIIQNITRSNIYKYTQSGNNGEFEFEGLFNVDSLAVTVSGVNIESTTKYISNSSQRLTFKVKEKYIEIKEVVVKSTVNPVRRGGDTLTYIASKYLDSKDVVLEDVIKKLPGIDVEASGKILYQGKEISKLYIEGLDMLGGRYALASKNIGAKDIRSIEVYENHQHVLALKNGVRPDRAAMNIRLHENAKGVWVGSALLGGGYKPLMWRGEFVAMYFGKKYSSINTYKTNNTGNDISKENSLLYDGQVNSETLLNIMSPPTPPLSKGFYHNNNVHSITGNALIRISKTAVFKVNAGYVHDIVKSNGISTTIHNIPGAIPVVIDEITVSKNKINNVNVDLSIEDNKAKKYVNNSLYFNGEFNNDYGVVDNDSDHINQKLKFQAISFKNNLQMIIPIAEKLSFKIRSEILYNNQPTTLKVTPIIFPELFSGSHSLYSTQDVNSSKFVTKNSLFTSYNTGNFEFSVVAGLNAHVEDMQSSLFSGVELAADSMRNKINWQRYDITIGPSVSYKLKDILSVNFFFKADFINLNQKDKIRTTKDQVNTVFANPGLSINGNITQELKYSMSASYSEYYGSLYDSYNGFIMTDYRHISTKDGKISHTKQQNYHADISYSNVLSLIFTNFSFNYWRYVNNVTYANNYDGGLTYIEAILRPNTSSGYALKGKISKQFLNLSTLASIGGSWNRSWYEIIRQDAPLNACSNNYKLLFELNTRFTKWLNFNYTNDYVRTESKANTLTKPLVTKNFVQNFEISFSLGNNFIAATNCKHYYNASYPDSNKNMYFLGAQIMYKTNKVTYSIDGINLLNTNEYNSLRTTDITEYKYSYTLRPASVLATVKFNF